MHVANDVEQSTDLKNEETNSLELCRDNKVIIYNNNYIYCDIYTHRESQYNLVFSC